MAISHVKSNTIPDMTGTVTVYNSQGSTQTAAASDLVRPSDWNSGHQYGFGMAGNTTGASASVTASDIVFGFKGNLYGSYSSAANTATLWISDNVNDYYEKPRYGNTVSMTAAAGNMYFFPFTLSENITFNQFRFLQSFATQSRTTFSLSASVGAGNASSATGTAGTSVTVGIFMRQSETGANSANLISIASGLWSASAGASQSVSWQTTTTQSATASWTMSEVFGGFPGAMDLSGNYTTTSFGSSTTTTFSSTSAGTNSFSTSYSNQSLISWFSGWRPMIVPIYTSLGPGEYWLGINSSTNSSSTNASALMGIVNGSVGSLLAFTSNTTSSYLEYGNTASTSGTHWFQGWGSYNGTANTSTSFPFNQITSIASELYWHAQWELK